MLMDLRHALVFAERDPEVKVIIIKGAGRAFSAGYDLEASYDFSQGLSPLVMKQDHIKYYHHDVVHHLEPSETGYRAGTRVCHGWWQ
jgi:enoyl-CoA hydratase/carnithine racemase